MIKLAMNKKAQLLLSLFVFLTCGVTAQVPVKEFFKDSTYSIEGAFANAKIAKNYKKQIEIALSYYPELRDTKIIFKEKATLIPLQARPTVWSVFQRKKNRTYMITISTKTIKSLEPILLKNLSFNAQIGVLGHEISHIAEFYDKSGWFFIKLFIMHLSRSYMDKFEYNTDQRAIDHGLGYQLLAWSQEVHQKFEKNNNKNHQSKGMMARERYMHPTTIQKKIEVSPLYFEKVMNHP